METTAYESNIRKKYISFIIHGPVNKQLTYNEQVLEHIGEKRTLLSNILRRKANLIGHILRRNCLVYDAIEGQMMEVKGVGRS